MSLGTLLLILKSKPFLMGGSKIVGHHADQNAQQQMLRCLLLSEQAKLLSEKASCSYIQQAYLRISKDWAVQAEALLNKRM